MCNELTLLLLRDNSVVHSFSLIVPSLMNEPKSSSLSALSAQYEMYSNFSIFTAWSPFSDIDGAFVEDSESTSCFMYGFWFSMFLQSRHQCFKIYQLRKRTN